MQQRLSKLEAAQRLGVSPSTLDRMIRRGELEIEREGRGDRAKVWVLAPGLSSDAPGGQPVDAGPSPEAELAAAQSSRRTWCNGPDWNSRNAIVPQGHLPNVVVDGGFGATEERVVPGMRIVRNGTGSARVPGWKLMHGRRGTPGGGPVVHGGADRMRDSPGGTSTRIPPGSWASPLGWGPGRWAQRG